MAYQRQHNIRYNGIFHYKRCMSYYIMHTLAVHNMLLLNIDRIQSHISWESQFYYKVQRVKEG